MTGFVSVDKSSLMVGSYGPRAEAHEYLTPADEAPKGMIARGHYTAKSKFIDDDKVVYLEWEWSFDIKKDWDQHFCASQDVVQCFVLVTLLQEPNLLGWNAKLRNVAKTIMYE